MTSRVMLLLKWLPRLAAVVMAGGFLMFIGAEILHPHSGPPTKFMEWLGIGLVSLGCLAPLLAWKWELEGALLSLASLAAFFVMIEMRSLGVVAVMGVPALLFLTDWALRRTLPRPDQSGNR